MGAPLPLALIGSPCAKLCRRSRTGRRCFGVLEEAPPGLVSIVAAMLVIGMLEKLVSRSKMVVLMVSSITV